MKLSEFLQEIKEEFGDEPDLTLRVTTSPDMDYDAIAVVVEGKDASIFLSFPGHKRR